MNIQKVEIDTYFIFGRENSNIVKNLDFGVEIQTFVLDAKFIFVRKFKYCKNIVNLDFDMKSQIFVLDAKFIFGAKIQIGNISRIDEKWCQGFQKYFLSAFANRTSILLVGLFTTKAKAIVSEAFTFNIHEKV